jgi:hypothetical protein
VGLEELQQWILVLSGAVTLMRNPQLREIAVEAMDALVANEVPHAVTYRDTLRASVAPPV